MELILGIALIVAVLALGYVAVRQRPSDLRIADIVITAYEQGFRMQLAHAKDQVDQIVPIQDQIPNRPEDQAESELATPPEAIPEETVIGEYPTR